MATEATNDTRDRGPDAPSLRDRLLAAVSYLGPGFLIPAFLRGNDAYVRWHVAQGFVVFFVEAAAVAVAIVIDQTIGQIPWLGLLVMVLIRIALLVAFLVVSAIGIVKALAGERFEIPLIGRYARHVPGATDGP